MLCEEEEQKKTKEGEGEEEERRRRKRRVGVARTGLFGGPLKFQHKHVEMKLTRIRQR